VPAAHRTTWPGHAPAQHRPGRVLGIERVRLAAPATVGSGGQGRFTSFHVLGQHAVGQGRPDGAGPLHSGWPGRPRCRSLPPPRRARQSHERPGACPLQGPLPPSADVGRYTGGDVPVTLVHLPTRRLIASSAPTARTVRTVTAPGRHAPVETDPSASAAHHPRPAVGEREYVVGGGSHRALRSRRQRIMLRRFPGTVRL
jgi:hypothetical protein